MAQYDVLCICYIVSLFLTKTGIHDIFMCTCAVAYITHNHI